jgi:hypothetical protein
MDRSHTAGRGEPLEIEPSAQKIRQFGSMVRDFGISPRAPLS